MISLSDSELAVILDAARIVPWQERSQFLRDVAAELGRHREIGPGLIHRVAREQQRKHFEPPLMGSNHVSKYGRQ